MYESAAQGDCTQNGRPFRLFIYGLGRNNVARIAGVDLPRDKRVEIGLRYIYGIGPTRSKEIIAKTGVNPDIRVKDLSEADVAALREAVEGGYQIEGDLRRFESMSIKRLMDIGCYRGRRHRMGLPVRGQRTRTNARTRRGGRRTVAGKKKAPGKK
ncbi:30S ribosomal protein S13 [Leptolyngbya sp. NIES-2104]|uniref:30S ribosomal protein S13 n=1 Tax=Leptolyngbya sp. NIES-2104 TaxID=1552121 RepID=UPI0026C2870B